MSKISLHILEVPIFKSEKGFKIPLLTVTMVVAKIKGVSEHTITGNRKKSRRLNFAAEYDLRRELEARIKINMTLQVPEN